MKILDEKIAVMLQAQAILQASGWFDRGVDMLNRLRKANFTDDELCWYIPRGVLGQEALAKGTTLLGLPVYEATSSCPPGIGIPLPVCSKNLECKAHIEPPRDIESPWFRWAKQHGVPVD